MSRILRVKDKDFKLLIPRSAIATRVAALAEQINADFHGQEVLFVGIMNGSFIFAADLLREIKLCATISFMRLSSYQGQSSAGQVEMVFGLPGDLKGKNVIVLEDIVETGTTLEYAIGMIKKMNPARLAVATLLFKPQALTRTISLDYVGFELEENFVVGYGLDYDGYGRNLSSLYVMA